MISYISELSRKSFAEIFPNIVRNILKSQRLGKVPLANDTEKLNKHVGQDGLFGNADFTNFGKTIQRERKRSKRAEKQKKGDRVRAKI